MENRQWSDDEVVASVVAGRHQDFEVLVRRYSSRLLHFVTRMTADPDEARSLTQDAFVRVFQSLPGYRPENNFSAYLFRVAKNLTLNWLNRQKRTVFFSRLLGGEFSQDGFRHDPPATTPQEQRERDSDVTRGLRRLPEEQRLALVLKVYLEFSYKQIADITGWSLPKIETLISRAKSRLKKSILLQDRGGETVIAERKK